MGTATTDLSCPNCAASITNKFCANCGQSVRTFRLSFWRLVWDFIGETFEFDGRLARTLSELFLRPGGLPQAFSENRRASFVSPVRMYLFSSLLFFFLLALNSADDLQLFESADNFQIVVDESSVGVNETSEIPTVEPSASQPASAPAPERLQADSELLLPHLDEISRRRLVSLLAEPYREVNHRFVAALSENLAEMASRGEAPGWWVRRGLVNVIALLENLSGYVSSIVENLPLAMFVLLPFYALLLKLLFFSSGRYFAEHLVFALYLHVVAFLAFSVSILVPSAETGLWAIVQPLVSAAAFGYLGIYTYLSMRNYYGQDGSVTGWSIGWRFLAMGVCYLLLLIPALLLVMAFSFIGL